jgi:hypothetical protein
LVKLAQVIQVVDVVAVALGAGGFAAGGKPDVLDTDGGEFGDFGNQSLPVLVVGGDIPLEALEEGVVLWRGLLLWSWGLAWFCYGVECGNVYTVGPHICGEGIIIRYQKISVNSVTGGQQRSNCHRPRGAALGIYPHL